MLAETLLKYLIGDTLDKIFFKKNIDTSTHQVDPGQLWLTCETHDIRY